jgi:SAM-dependent methyltransferase
LRRLSFSGTAPYWERRYLRGGDSGADSSGELAQYKARFVNTVVRQFGAVSVIEWGCGDGQQLALAEYQRYVGLDVSATAIRLCLERFPQDKSKSFLAYDASAPWDGVGFMCSDAALSLDVIYHLVEDSAFETYMTNLLLSAKRLVIIYSKDIAMPSLAPHIRYRKFSEWITVQPLNGLL